MFRDLSGIVRVNCLMDNILVIGRDQAEYDQRLKQAHNRPMMRRLATNLERCVFWQIRLQYLGQIIDSEGVRKDP